jgi:hypothetical protein
VLSARPFATPLIANGPPLLGFNAVYLLALQPSSFAKRVAAIHCRMKDREDDLITSTVILGRFWLVHIARVRPQGSPKSAAPYSISCPGGGAAHRRDRRSLCKNPKKRAPELTGCHSFRLRHHRRHRPVPNEARDASTAVELRIREAQSSLSMTEFPMEPGRVEVIPEPSGARGHL